jgi:hypothetical protein
MLRALLLACLLDALRTTSGTSILTVVKCRGLVICSLFCCTACGCCSLTDLMPLGQATDKVAAAMQLMAGNAPCGACVIGTAGDSAKVFECADAAAKPILLAGSSAAASDAGSSAAASDASPGDFQSTFDRCTPNDPYVCTNIGASNLTFRCRVSGPETGHPSGSAQPRSLAALHFQPSMPLPTLTHLPPGAI